MHPILQFFRSFVRLDHPYTSAVDRYRAQLLIVLVDVLFLLNFVFLVLGSLEQRQIVSAAPNLPLIIGVVLLFTTPLVIRFIQRGGLRWAALIFVVVFTAIITLAELTTPFDSRQQIVTFVPILLASILLRWYETLLVMLVMIAVNIYAIVAAPAFDINRASLTSLVALPVFLVFMTGILLTTSQWLVRLALRAQAEISRLRQITFPLLRLGLNVDENAFINQAIESIAANLEFPTVRVYLTNAENLTTMRLVQPGLSLDEQIRQTVDPGSSFASVLQTRQPLFIDQDSTAAERTHFLPGSTNGALLPLLYREQVIGVLDIQSVGERIIDDSERELLTLIALHLATTIGNTRTLDVIQNEAKQQQDIILRQRNRLRQIEQTEQQAIVTAWTDYLDQRDQRIIGFDVNEMSMQLIPTDYMPDHMREALARNDVTTYEQDNQQHVTLPIQLRGQTLGAASFTVPQNRPITRRQVEIMRNVIQRLALALDNKRLFEQSQSQALRESKANEIASLLLSSTDMDTVLRLAAVNFNDALGAVQTRIQLFPETAQEERR